MLLMIGRDGCRSAAGRAAGSIRTAFRIGELLLRIALLGLEGGDPSLQRRVGLPAIECRDGRLDRRTLRLQLLLKRLGPRTSVLPCVWSWVEAARQALHSCEIRSVSTTATTAGPMRCAWAAARNGKRKRGKRYAESMFFH
jgi:hypothetical protein